jgi:hypothetical protein
MLIPVPAALEVPGAGSGRLAADMAEVWHLLSDLPYDIVSQLVSPSSLPYVCLCEVCATRDMYKDHEKGG